MSRLDTTRDLSLVAAAAAVVAFAVVELREALTTRPPVPPLDLYSRPEPPAPAAPYGWLQPVGRVYGAEVVRPALAEEAEAFDLARDLDPAGLVGRTHSGELVLPDHRTYGDARQYFHVTADRLPTDEPAEVGTDTALAS